MSRRTKREKGRKGPERVVVTCKTALLGVTKKKKKGELGRHEGGFVQNAGQKRKKT